MHQEIQKWLKRLEDAPLECDGMTRCISTVLSLNGIPHQGHVGSLTVAGVGRIPLHFWISLSDNTHIDLRAQMWLGANACVPHGLFMPSQDFEYETHAFFSSKQLQQSDVLFKILSNHELNSFKS